MKTVLVTKDSLKAMLDSDDRYLVEVVIGRALSAILERQTADEKASSVTMAANGVGFTGADAYSGTQTANYFKRHGHLGGNSIFNQAWRADKWLKLAKNGYPRLCKYADQLNSIAVAKQLENQAAVALKELQEFEESEGLPLTQPAAPGYLAPKDKSYTTRYGEPA